VPFTLGYGLGKRVTFETEFNLLTSFRISDSSETGIGDIEPALSVK